MLDPLKCGLPVCADSLAGRVRRHQIGVLLLQLFEFGEELVIRGVGYFGRMLLEVESVVLRDLVAQMLNPLFDTGPV